MTQVDLWTLENELRTPDTEPLCGVDEAGRGPLAGPVCAAAVMLPPGLEIAQSIYTRHQVLTKFLEYLGVSKEIAEADACKIEHDISSESFEKILAFSVGHGVFHTAGSEKFPEAN